MAIHNKNYYPTIDCLRWRKKEPGDSERSFMGSKSVLLNKQMGVKTEFQILPKYILILKKSIVKIYRDRWSSLC